MSVLRRAWTVTWNGPFYIGPITRPASVGDVLLKILETIWRVGVLLVLGISLIVGGAFGWSYLSEQREERARLHRDQYLIELIVEQLKPNWKAPVGQDADKLVTFVTWTMNPDGTIAAQPRISSQSGVTETNRMLADDHASNAIAAVTRTAPFKLPSSDYRRWHRVTVAFDKED